MPMTRDDPLPARLEGAALPHVRLPSTRGRLVDVHDAAPRFVLFAYPRTGRPDEPALPGWDEIPGARGCTPQSCAYRDLHAEFRALGHEVFGLSANSPAHQAEFVARMGIPYEMLSDEACAVADAMGLPTFEYRGARLLTRLAMVVHGGRVVQAFFPVPDPQRNAADVLAWLRLPSRRSRRP